jgi:eukaryotic translation initiation factor 2C
VEEYFKRKYNLTLQWPEFPVLETTKRGVVYPMECSIMLGGQRYPYKLNELQVRISLFALFLLTDTR